MRNRRFGRRGFSTEVLAETLGGVLERRAGRVAHPAPDPGQDEQSGRPGNDQHRQGRPERSGHGGYGSDKEWSGYGADLVEGLVHTHAATESDRAGGMGQQSRLGRTAYGFAEPFGQDQEAGERQTGAGHERCNGQQRHADCCYGVAGIGDGPVAAGPIGPGSEDHAQQECHRLARAGDQSDEYRGSAQRCEQGSRDRSGSFVDHVGGQADHAESDHRSPR